MTMSTHVLDTARGCPAEGIGVRLEILRDAKWETVSSSHTNDDGRTRPLPDGVELEAATYRITFDVDAYFEKQDTEGFYPYASIVFRVKDPTQHYHVPLLLSPFGYSTYRGS